MATTTVRPTSTDRNVSVNTSGGASAFSVLDDSPDDDATRAQGSTHGAYLWLGIPNVTLSATVRLKQARVRVRIRHDGTDVGWPESVNVAFRDPTLNKYGTDLTASNSVAGTTVPWSGGWDKTAPGGGVWTQAVVDRLQVKIWWRASQNFQFAQITETYVDFQTDTQPTVSGVTVTGATTTTRPAFSWTYADTEGDPQVAWRARVFDAAQYGAAGFDPATSVSTWDSAVQLGDADNAAVTADLVNGVTYRVYVAAAQAWAGPEGGPWWSAWVASSNFTVAVSPPPTPTLTVTPEPGLPGYRHRIVVSLANVNVLTADSAGFEGGVGDWVADVNCAVVTSATNPKSGALALQMTATAGATMTARSGGAASAKRVTPGGTYTAVASYRTAVTARTVNTGIRWFDVSGATISDTYGTNQTDGTGGYVTATYTGAAPANAFSAVVLAKVTSAAAAEVHRVDEPGLWAGAGTTWTPGGYSTGSVVVERSQRISTQVSRGPARNWMSAQMHSAGALTTATAGFYPRNAIDSVVQRVLDRPAPESPGNTTAGMIEWQVRTGAGSYLDLGLSDGAVSDGMNPFLLPAVAGVSFTGTVWLWASAAITVQWGLYFVDAYNTTLAVTLGSNTVLTTSPQKLTVAATAPAATVYARLVVFNQSTTNNVSVYLTQPRFRPTNEPDESWPGQVWVFTWESVRGGTRTIPTDGTPTVALYDHEPPAGRPVMYTAQLVATTTTGQSIASARSIPVHVMMDPPTWSVLKDPFQPENAAFVYRAPGDTTAPDEDATELHPAGRDADPVIVRDWASGERGTVVVHLFTDVDHYRLRQLIPSPRTLLIHWSTGGTMFVRIVRQSFTAVRGPYVLASLDYVQQARP